MSKFLLFIGCLRLAFPGGATFTLAQYFYIKASIQQNNPTKYTIEKTAVHGGRGTYYDMDVRYKGAIFKELPITRKIYNHIANGQHPDLYYAARRNKIYSKWSQKLSISFFVTLVLFSAISFIPAKKWK